MNTDDTISGDDAALATLLTRKREGLLARLAELRTETQRLEAVLAGIDGTLHLLDPATLAAPPLAGRKAKAGAGAARSGWRFAHGECRALMQQALREAARPLSTTELVRAVLAKKSLPVTEEASVRLAVRYVLRKGADGGTGIAEAEMTPPTTFPRWALVV